MANDGEPDDSDVQSALGALPVKLKRRLVEAIKEQADYAAERIRAAAPTRTGALRNSVKVRRGRNTLELVIEAGGDETKREYGGRATYERAVVIEEGNANQGIARKPGGAGVSYDYAFAAEFGNSHVDAHPFFYSTWRAIEPDVREAIEQAVEQVLGEL